MTDPGFAALDEHLATPFTLDHWEGDAIGYAQALITRLTPADWAAFDAVWARRPVIWQARAAQVLSHGAPTYAVPLLVRMTESRDRTSSKPPRTRCGPSVPRRRRWPCPQPSSNALTASRPSAPARSRR
jgi:hypothetical protein